MLTMGWRILIISRSKAFRALGLLRVILIAPLPFSVRMGASAEVEKDALRWFLINLRPLDESIYGFMGKRKIWERKNLFFFIE